MYRRLKWHFALLCTGLTGLVLLITCVIAFYMGKTELTASYQNTFDYFCSAYEHQFADGDTLAAQQVYDFENSHGIISYFFDNGTLVSTPSIVGADTRAELLKAAQAAINSGNTNGESSFDKPPQSFVDWNFTSTYDGAPYMGKFIQNSTGEGTWYSIVLLYPTSALADSIRTMALQYTLLFVGLLALLAVISWVLAKISVRPVEKAQKRQTEFIAAAGHELKSPLAVMVASAEVVAQDSDNISPARKQEHLTNMVGEAERMARLVDDLLLLAGSGSGNLNIRAQKTSAESLLIAAYDLFSPLAQKSGHPFSIILPDETLPDIMADRERVIQILSILLSNALEHTGSGTAIELRGTAAKDEVVFSVVDHGKGIPDSDKTQVFFKFYRADAAHTDKSHYGLGLSVAEELAHLHGSKIELCDTPGGGATFLFSMKSIM